MFLLDLLSHRMSAIARLQRYNNYRRNRRGNTPGKPGGFPLLCRHRVKRRVVFKLAQQRGKCIAGTVPELEE